MKLITRFNTQKLMLRIIAVLAFSSCNIKNENAQIKNDVKNDTTSLVDQHSIVEVSKDLNSRNGKIKFYLTHYQNDTCKAEKYNESSFLKDFEGIKEIGDLNYDKKIDSVFVLPALNLCENGQSYYFSDTKLPRLSTESNCCHPENVFFVGDIDEDGVSEIGQYFSSCASRYKSLYVYSLKDNLWKEVGHCVYDLNFSGEKENYDNYVKKTGKGAFEMLEITDLTKDKSKIGKKNWLKFKM